MLLSFAQFEREIAGERIRDKIAASKKKGMWMGGNVPLGYGVKDRKLVVNELEAATVGMKNSSARSRHRPPNNQPKPQPCCSCTAFNEACTAFLRIMSRIVAAFEHFRRAALRSAPHRDARHAT